MRLLFNPGVLETSRLEHCFLDALRDCSTTGVDSVLDTGLKASQKAVDLFVFLTELGPKVVEAVSENVQLDLAKEVLEVADYLGHEQIVTQLCNRFRVATLFADSELMRDTPLEYDSNSRFRVCGTLKIRHGICSMTGISDSLVALGTLYGCIEVWNVDNRTQQYVFKAHQKRTIIVKAVGSSKIASVSDYGEVKVWDLTTQECAATLNGSGHVSAILPLPDGRLVVGYDEQTAPLRLWDFMRPEITAFRNSRAAIKFLEALPDGSIVSGARDGSVRLWDLSTMSHTAQLVLDGGCPANMCVFPDGSILVHVVESVSHNFKILDGKTLTELERIKVEGLTLGIPSCIGALHNGLFVHGVISRMLFITSSTGECAHELDVHVDIIREILVLQPNRILVTSFECDPVVLKQESPTTARRQVLKQLGLNHPLVDAILA